MTTDLLHMITSDVILDPLFSIDVDTDLLLTGLVDSLGVVQIVGWIEDNMDIEVEATDVVLENFQTVRKMLAYIDSRN